MKSFLWSISLLLLSVTPALAGPAGEFFTAVRNGNNRRVEEMIGKDKTLVFAKNKDGMTPFLVAVETQNLKMVSLLADYFSRLDNVAAPGNAMHIAVSNNDEPMVRLLVRLTAEEDASLPKHLFNMPRRSREASLNDSNTPLHLAAQKCNFRIYNYLLQHGANPSLRNASGQTPKQIISACPQPKPANKQAASEKASTPRPARAPAKIQDPPPLIFPVN